MGYMQLSLGIQEDTAPAFNYLFKILAPVVYIVLLALLFQVLKLPQFCEKLYLVVIYYWTFRLIAVAFLGHLSLLNWGDQVLYWGISIGLAVWVNSLIDKLETILPSPESLVDELWLLIFMFIYSIANKLQYSRAATIRRKQNYIDRKYREFHMRFGEQVESKFKGDFLRALTFSIMIYENYNRPTSARFLERVFFKKSSRKHTFGIMQVMSDHILTDDESLDLAMIKIEHDCHLAFRKRFEREEEEGDSIPVYFGYIICEVAGSYNHGEGYVGEVNNIFDRLAETTYKNMPSYYSESDMK